MKSLTRIWSPQQLAVFDFVATGKGNAFVGAVAGAGKTTVLVESCIRANGTVAFLAFNRIIADEIESRINRQPGLNRRVNVGTFHKFGLKSWLHHNPGVMAGPEAIRLRSAETTPLVKFRPISVVEALVTQAKNSGIGLPGGPDLFDAPAWINIIDHFDMEDGLPSDMSKTALINAGIALLEDHKRLSDTWIGFDDMCYMPLAYGARAVKYDWVITDECQDLNTLQRLFVANLLKPEGRALFCGDRHQAIYAWRGADADAVGRICTAFNCTELPLNTTYRCPKKVVEKAQEVVPHITAHETAPEGSVSTLREPELLNTEFRMGADAVLCRINRPLVSLAFSLIENNIPVHVEGRDIGKGLLKLVRKFYSSDLSILMGALSQYVEAETLRLTLADKSSVAASLLDQYDTLVVLSDNVKSVKELEHKIQSLFKDGDVRTNRVTLCSIHRAKGREWDRVFILGENKYQPSPWAKKPWELSEEDNLRYVAATRARESLVYVLVE
jgi:DNA helicase II / ATP-dependent DNA helicase PcrA